MSEVLALLPVSAGPKPFTVAGLAERWKCDPVTVLRKCPKWNSMGLARMKTPPGGGKPVWMIDPRADKRLMVEETKGADAGPNALLGLTAEQRKTLQEELAFMLQADAAGRAGVRAGIGRCEAIQNFLKREARKGWGFSQFNAKYKAWRKSGKRIEALIDGRWTAKKDRSRRGDRRMLDEATKFYLDASAPSVAECVRAAEQLAMKGGWQVWKESAVRAHLKRLPPAEVMYKRHGMEAFRNKHEPYIQRTYAGLKSNEIWQSDHMRFDVICVLGEKLDRTTGALEPQLGRPWLTTWIDVRSRKILAYEVRAADPDSGVILKVFRRAALEFGVPETVYTDCGKDYDHRDFTGETKAQRRARRRENADADTPKGGIWDMLGIEHVHAEPYNARAKLVERMHRTIKEQFCRGWDTFTGGTTVEKPERLGDMVAKGRAPALEDFAVEFAAWVTLYNGRKHGGESMGASPDAVYAENLENKRTAVPEMLDLMLLRRVGPVKVGRNGVRYLGLYFGQYDTGAWQEQQVYLRVDDSDLSKVSVWDCEDRHFLCVARANQQLPANVSRETLREAIHQQRKESRARRNAHDARMHLHEDIPAVMARLEQERAAAKRVKIQPAKPTIVPVRSALESELPKVQRALEALKPATAEQRKQRAQSQKDFMAAIEDACDRGKAERDAEAERMDQTTRNVWAAYGRRDSELEPAPSESPFRKPVVNVPSLTEIMEGAA